MDRSRPDVITNAETVVFPTLIPNGPATPHGPYVSLVASPASVELPSSAGAADEGPADEGYTPTRRRTRVSRMALLGILALQALLSLRLRNSAFEDEALYLYAGRLEIAHLLHGAALQGSYASYFSGAPVLYPVLGAALNAAGGLLLARALSLAEMLAVTAILYSVARQLFNERVALCAAALFAVSESALFLGSLATFDATCLLLLACATLIVVRWAGSRWPVILLAAPVVVLAVAVKYAGLIFVPTIVVLPAIAGWPVLRRRALLYPPVLALTVAALLYGALVRGGPAYAAAIAGTTTSRAQGVVPVAAILKESAAWGGVIIALALFGAVAYAIRPRTEPGESIAPAGGRLRRAALGVLLACTAFLAPLYQAHLHTDVSLHKHIGFGLFFAAPLAGVGLARLVGDHFHRPQVGVGLWCLALVLGMAQSQNLYQAWPQAGPLVRALSPYLRHDAKYLVEVPEVPIYYLQGNADAQPSQFWSTYNITYIDSRGKTLTGNAGFQAAIMAGYFGVVAYDGDTTPAADAVIARALRSSRRYRLATVVNERDSAGPVRFYVWVETLSSRTPRAAAPSSFPQPRFGHSG
jgi:4-amino-4-deoxy-L-arabinose transferase-like glycosyltransferase